MQGKATTVTEYLRSVPADRLDALIELRELCMQTLKGFKEGMQFGIPSYSWKDEVKFAWSGQKEYISIFIVDPNIFNQFKAQLKHVDLGKSSIRYKQITEADFAMIKKFLQQIADAAN